jgi:hypothetical protein
MHDTNKIPFRPNDVVCYMGGGTEGFPGEIRKIKGYSAGGLLWVPYTLNTRTFSQTKEAVKDTASSKDPLLLKGWQRFVYSESEPVLADMMEKIRACGVLADSDCNNESVFINIRATSAEKRVIELTRELAVAQEQLKRMRGIERIPVEGREFSDISTAALMVAGMTIRQASQQSDARLTEA